MHGRGHRRPELGERLVDDVEADARAAEHVGERVELVGRPRPAQHPGQLGDRRGGAHGRVDRGRGGLGGGQVDVGGVDERPRVAQRRAGQVGDVGQQRQLDPHRLQDVGGRVGRRTARASAAARPRCRRPARRCAPSTATGRRRSRRAAGRRSGRAAGGPSGASPRRRPGPARRRRPRAPAPAGSAPAPSTAREPLSCRSRANMPMPVASSRRATTSRAARFSATNSTLLPAATACAEQVGDRLRLAGAGRPLEHERAAGVGLGDRPQLRGVGRGGQLRGELVEVDEARRCRAAGSVNASVGSCTRWLTSGFSAKSAQCSSRSFHSRNLANCRIARSAVASTR